VGSWADDSAKNGTSCPTATKSAKETEGRPWGEASIEE
jgi:hypothetical protein